MLASGRTVAACKASQVRRGEESQPPAPLRGKSDTSADAELSSRSSDWTHIVASKLQETLTKAAGHLHADFAASRLGPRKAEKVDPLVVDERLASLATAAHQRRQSRIELVRFENGLDNLGGRDRGQRGGWGRFPNGRVAGHERERKVPAKHGVREVESGDLCVSQECSARISTGRQLFLPIKTAQLGELASIRLLPLTTPTTPSGFATSII